MPEHTPKPKHEDERAVIYTAILEVDGASANTALERRPAADQHQIEDYLDRECVLTGNVTPFYRQQLREKLEAQIAALCELGSPPYEAITTAIEKSTAERLAEQLASSVKSRSKHRAESSMIPATLAALAMLSPLYVAVISNATFSIAEYFTLKQTAARAIEVIIAPIVAGLLTGLIARHKVVPGTAAAVGLIAIPGLWWPCLIWGIWSTGQLTGYDGRMLGLRPGYVGLAFWIVLAPAGAWVGSKIRQRYSAARQQKRRE